MAWTMSHSALALPSATSSTKKSTGTKILNGNASTLSQAKYASHPVGQSIPSIVSNERFEK